MSELGSHETAAFEEGNHTSPILELSMPNTVVQNAGASAGNGTEAGGQSMAAYCTNHGVLLVGDVAVAPTRRQGQRLARRLQQ